MLNVTREMRENKGREHEEYITMEGSNLRSTIPRRQLALPEGSAMEAVFTRIQPLRTQSLPEDYAQLLLETMRRPTGHTSRYGR